MSDDHDDHDDHDDAEDAYDEGDDAFEDLDGPVLDDHESAMVHQDLTDLENFEATFRAEGYRGVAVWCQDCAEDHFYPWDMLRENLHLLLETGETPVHEPAFEPDPDEYIPWEYARGYVDALQDVGVGQRLDVALCHRCGFHVPDELVQANFCPRCGTAMLPARLVAALEQQGLDAATISQVLRAAGMPG
jgi:hypothetical protein